MGLSKESMVEFATLVASAVVEALEKKHIIGNVGNGSSANAKPEKTAYQKTETLLYNYNGFQKIVQERMDEIEEIRKYGVPKCSSMGGAISGKGGLAKGIVLEEESVEAAVRRINDSVESTVQALALIDKCMKSLENDLYYDILPMFYFEGRTQEDIAIHIGVSQVSVSKNKKRLVQELSIRLFPNQSINEMLS